MSLVIHGSLLLPSYVYPVGLNIVDQHAKFPEWLSRATDSYLSAKIIQKAREEDRKSEEKGLKYSDKFLKIVRHVNNDPRAWFLRNRDL